MFIFQVWATVGPEIKTGALLADNPEHALAKAVETVKRQYGEAGRIKRIVKVLDVSDVRKLHHSGLIKVLSSFEQCDLICQHLGYIVERQISMVNELRNLIKERMKNE